jgi:hypothetical protein
MGQSLIGSVIRHCWEVVEAEGWGLDGQGGSVGALPIPLCLLSTMSLAIALPQAPCRRALPYHTQAQKQQNHITMTVSQNEPFLLKCFPQAFITEMQQKAYDIRSLSHLPWDECVWPFSCPVWADTMGTTRGLGLLCGVFAV